MSKKICRTCLKVTYKTYKTYENIHYRGETEQLKISDMLRYLIPELYLGVTVNPEICEECRTILRTAYAFRKKCMATENIIGSYLKKSRCTASSIELIDVILFWEQKKKDERIKTYNDKPPDKAQEIISEWDDDASQDSEESNVLSSKKEKTSQILPIKEKELTLCPELGVFVDKFGNRYNADGISIDDPETIINTESDFLKITDVFSVNDEDEPIPEKQNTNSTVEQSNVSDKQKPTFRIRVIPEAKTSFTAPSISVIPEAKTDLMEPRTQKMIKVRKDMITSPASDKQEANTKTIVPCVLTPPVTNDAPEVDNEPLLPIIVDVRSECESNESSIPIISSDCQSENAESTTPNENVKEVKKEPVEHLDDEETLTGSETNSNYESIQGILDSLPDDNSYVDVPEFVHINNFSLKDLDELRQNQQNSTNSVASVQFPPFNPTIVTKPFVKILPKPDGIAAPVIMSVEEIPRVSTDTVTSESIKAGVKKPSMKCIVPKCQNNSDLNLKKIYVMFPRNFHRRSKWFEAIGILPLPSHDLYICEDHFDLPNDMENWMQFKLFGGRMRMKDDVVPHRFINEKAPDKVIYKSQLDDADRKRRAVQRKRLERTKILKLSVTDKATSSDVKGQASASSQSASPISSVSEIQNQGDAQPQSNQMLVQAVIDHAKAKPKNYRIGDKQNKPRIIRKKPRNVKIVPVEYKTTERNYKGEGADVCVLYTNYTPTGTYINDHDYLSTPYKRNKVLINENDQWLCMCFLCGSKHFVNDHVDHMNLHSAICNVCKMNLGTPFMLNMHVRFHSKKCTYCTEKVMYRDLAKHEMMHLREIAKIDSEREGRSFWMGRRNTYGNEKPVYFPNKTGNDSDREEDTVPTSSRKLRTISPDNSKKTTETPTETVEQSPKITKSVQRTVENDEKPKEIVPVKTESPTDTKVMEYEDMKSSSEELKKRSRRTTRYSAIKHKSISPSTNEETKRRRKNRSREIEPVKVEQSSSRVLRSRQKKDCKEERKSPVPENNLSSSPPK